MRAKRVIPARARSAPRRSTATAQVKTADAIRTMQRRVRDERKIQRLARAIERAIKRTDVRLRAMVVAIAPALELEVIDRGARRMAAFPGSRAENRETGDLAHDDAEAIAALT